MVTIVRTPPVGGPKVALLVRGTSTLLAVDDQPDGETSLAEVANRSGGESARSRSIAELLRAGDLRDAAAAARDRAARDRVRVAGDRAEIHVPARGNDND